MKNFKKTICTNNPSCEYIFPILEDAKETLDTIKKIIFMYGVATVADLKDLIGYDIRYTDTKYGWTNSDRMAVRMLDVYDPNMGYLLYMPTPVLLETKSDPCKFKPALLKASKDAKIQKAYNALTGAYCKKDVDRSELTWAVEEAIGYLGEVLE